MAKDDQRFEHRSLQDSVTIVRYLDAIRDGLQQGHLTFKSGNSKLMVEPKGLLDLRIWARRSDDEVKISLRVKWREGKAEDYSPDPLVIEVQPHRKV